MTVDERKAMLRGYIANTRRNQRTLAIVTGAVALVAVALMFWDTTVGTLALVFVAMTAGIGFWVTTAHILEHRGKIDELDRAERLRKNPPPPNGGHRRWQARE